MGLIGAYESDAGGKTPGKRRLNVANIQAVGMTVARRKQRRGVRGEGTTYKEAYTLKNGAQRIRWVTRLTITDDQGRKLRKQFTGRTAEEARAKRAANQKLPASEVFVTNDNIAPSVADFLDRWLKDRAKYIKANTAKSYRDTIRLHINPILGSLLLCKLTSSHIERLDEVLRERGRSRTRKMAYQVLRAALNKAAKWHIISENPIRQIDVPRHAPTAIAPLNRQEARQFLAAAEATPYRALYWIAIFHGLRQGELFGLQWHDVNFETSTILIRRQMTELNGQCTLSPRTKNGKDRSILIATQVSLAL